MIDTKVDLNNVNTIGPHASTRLDETSEYVGLAHVVMMLFSELHKSNCTMISTLHLRWILLKGPKVVLKQGEVTLQIALNPNSPSDARSGGQEGGRQGSDGLIPG